MKRFAIAVILAVLMIGPALAQTPASEGTPTRVRATVEKLEGQNLTVKSRDGQNMTIVLAPNTTVVTLVKKSVADIKAGDYVASAGVKGPDGKLHAVEVRIFPEEMRGGNEGQRPWDLMPDSLMTNATVGKIEQAPSGPVLHVTFKGGESEYIVGPDVPVLGYGPGDLTLLKPGVAVFIGTLKKPDGSVPQNLFMISASKKALLQKLLSYNIERD